MVAVLLAAGILFWFYLRAGAGSLLLVIGDEKVRRRWLLLAILTFFCLSGWFRMKVEMKKWPLEVILAERKYGGERGGKTGTRVEAEGRICEVSFKNEIYTLVLGPVTVTAGEERYEEKRIMVSAEVKTAERLPVNRLKVGMNLWVRGKAELFQEARNPGEFDYRMYYRSQKLRCRIKADKIEAAGGEESAFWRQISSVRQFVKEALAFLYGEEDRGVFQAILLGDKSDMDSEIRELYQDGGIAHVLAVSGLHVSLIGMSLYGFLRKRGVGYGKAGVVSAALLFFYGSMTGFGASVFRAVFMVFCSFLASYLGRTYDLLSAMALSLILLLFDSPYLLFTSGLQLSYGAVGAVGLCNDWRSAQGKERRLSGESGKKRRDGNVDVGTMLGALQSALSVSLAIQVVTLPAILYHFFEFPLYGVILNLVVIPLMAYVAGTGIAAIGLYGMWKAVSVLNLVTAGGEIDGVLKSGLKQFLGGAAYLLGIISHGAAGPGHYILSLYRGLCRFTLQLPFATALTGRPPLWCIGIYYGALVFVYIQAVKRAAGAEGERTVRTAFGVRAERMAKTAACFLAVLFLTVRPRVRGLEVYFLDVGQGDGIFFRTGNVAALTDCGSSQLKSVGKNRLVPFLKSKGISRLDYIFISHGDSDHINGIVWMLENEENISVGQIVMPCLGEGEEVYRQIETLGKMRGADIIYMEAGQKLDEGTLKIAAVYPDGDVYSKDRNGHSLVLSVNYKEYSMLLTGDVGTAGEKRMLEMGSLEREIAGKRDKRESAETFGVQTETGEEPYKEQPEGRFEGRISVLKAAHHGSSTSTGQEFLACVKPSVTILSYGRGNSYGHPSPEVVERLEEIGTGIWSTERSGAIHVTTDGKKMKVSGFLLDRNRDSGL